MAEIVSNDDTNTSQPDYSDWTKGTSKNGKAFYYKSINEGDITIQPSKDQLPSAAAAADHGPPFKGVRCMNWTVGSLGPELPEFTTVTGIIWHSLLEVDSPVGTYQFTFKTNETYNYLFNTATGDSYEWNVSNTELRHSFIYSSNDPTILTVDGV